MPLLTPSLLGQIGQEMGGFVFDGPEQMEFLSSVASCDVQAAPGHGKTTLLVAKLALLARCWQSRAQGICVISHTNVARDEVEQKIVNSPSAAGLLRYPHFIGTVTAFLDRFVALPYLRGLGWTVHCIDDEVFAAAAGARWQAKQALVAYARQRGGANRHAVEQQFVPKLALAPDFACEVDAAPERLRIRHRHRQPGPNTASGRALEELKAELVRDGYFRFCDLTSLTMQALDKCPAIIGRLRERFPIVLLDEAQDTHGEQLAILNRLFAAGVVYQRLGDQNQVLYEEEELGPADYWHAAGGVIPLDTSRRFGPRIAAFASRLTVRAKQQITGVPDMPSSLAVILFCPDTIHLVLPTFATQVRNHWGDADYADLDIRAVASRHSPTSDRTGEWPKTLVDYYPWYHSGRGRLAKAATLCASLRQAALLHQRQAAPSEIVAVLGAGIGGLLHRQRWRNASGQAPDGHNLWRVLAEHENGLAVRVRRLLLDHIAEQATLWQLEGWTGLCDELRGLLGLQGELTSAASGFLEYVEGGLASHEAASEPVARTWCEFDGVCIKLGSIHSVKGKTVDGILVLETEVWRGHALADRAMDLATVLPRAFGLVNPEIGDNRAQLAAATNVFVAVTRPRQLLACAVRKEAVTTELVAAAGKQGWEVHDLTASAPPTERDPDLGVNASGKR